MEANQFERVVRVLTTSPSRRQALRGLAGTIFGGWLGFLVRPEMAAKPHKKKGKKSKSPSTRFVRATMPYTLVTGTVIATSWADLTDGSIAHAIDRTATGVAESLQGWTNTKADGTPGSVRAGTPSGGQHCVNWTRDFFDDKGYLGIPIELDREWTDFEERPCSDFVYRLYCFQQR